MQLTRVTQASVLRAIAECDRLGRERFLEDNGFREAREYYLLHGGGVYDSKAIVGVAYRFDTGIKVVAGDFTGGQVVADRLHDLGFTVTGDADWRWEELIVAADLLHTNGWQHTLRSYDAQVIELSHFLRGQRPELGEAKRYRSPDSVQRKLEDIRTVHPEYTGKPTRGGRLTVQVVEAFLADPENMHTAAQAIRSLGRLIEAPAGDADESDADESTDGSASDVAAAFEGRVLRRMVAVRERDPKLRRSKIAQSRAERGNIACETCGFDFEVVYGTLGENFIHVHHVVPLYFSGVVESTLDDLILLCANCHQMIHRSRPDWLTPGALRSLINEQRALRA